MSVDYEKIINELPISACVIQDDRFLLVNHKLSAYTGLMEKMAGMKIIDFIHPEDREMVLGNSRRRMAGEPVPDDYEFRVVVPGREGHILYVRAAFTLIEYNGRPATLGQIINITDQKKAEAALLSSENNYRAIFDSANDAIIVIDAETGKIQDINRKVWDLYGFAPEESRDLTILDLLERGTDGSMEDMMKIIMKEASGKPRLIEWKVRNRSGRSFWVEVNLKQAVIGDRNVILAVVRDIDDRKRAMEELKISEARYRAIVEDQTEYVCRFLPDGTITFANSAYCRFFGEGGEMTGRSFVLFVQDESGDSFMRKVSSLSLKKPVMMVESRVVAPNGEIRWQNWTTRAIFNDLGKFLEFQSVGRDVTERKNTEERLRQKASELRGIFRALPDTYLRLSPEGTVLDVKSGKTDEFYFSPVNIMGKRLQDVLPPAAARQVRQAFNKAPGSDSPVVVEFSVQSGRGEEFFEARFSTMPGRQMIAVIRNITDRKHWEEALRKSEEKNRAMIEALPDLTAIIDRDGRILHFKPIRDGIIPGPPEGSSGEYIYQVWPSKLARQTMSYVLKALKTGRIQLFDFQLSVEGKKREYEARIVVCGENEVLDIVRDITDRKRMEKELKYLSLHDPLTGLFNRAYFEQEMARLQGGRQAAGIILCDVDGLKLVNDTLGHEAGDNLLVTTAKVIKGAFRSGDMVARIGGDEFAVLLANSDRAAVEKAGERTREAISRYNMSDPEQPLSISIGIAAGSSPGLSMADLFKEADNNMYREKLHRSKSIRSSIVHTLMKALEARDFITEGHADRLQDLVEVLARGVGLPEQSISDLRLLAQFHDIGKVGIPDRILFKPGPLTREEFFEMVRHSEIGHRIAQSAPDLAPISDWILKHHEWWNGEGYPLGLRGDEIPLECRILSIADAYDAMTSDRPYRRAMDHDAAVDELCKCSGSQFDPALVPLFVRHFSLRKA
ncbi:MAG: PAS domain S-box protein [Bacillota bacterium]